MDPTLRDLWIPWIREFALTPTSFFILIWDCPLIYSNLGLVAQGSTRSRVRVWTVSNLVCQVSLFSSKLKSKPHLMAALFKSTWRKPNQISCFLLWDWFSAAATFIRSYFVIMNVIMIFAGGVCAGFSGFSSCGIQAEFPRGMWNIKVSWLGIKTHTHCTGRQILYPGTIREVPNVVMTFTFVLNVAQVPCCLSGLLHLFWAS